jgi:voltage-gated potassium channel
MWTGEEAGQTVDVSMGRYVCRGHGVTAGRAALERARPLRAVVRRRRRLTWLQALLLVGSISAAVVLAGGVLIRWTDPGRFPDLGTGWWWAITTVTTVGYGDHVPVSVGGRLVGAALMIVGIASFAFLTAVAASAIVVGEIGAEEQLIEREESEILAHMRDVDARLRRLEELLTRDEGRRGVAVPGPADARRPSEEVASSRAGGDPPAGADRGAEQ